MLAEYKELASALQEQDALEFLPSEYSESPELLRGFLSQRAILADHFTRADAGAIEVPMGGSPGGAVALQKPLSRGTVTISSKTYDPDEWPVIDFGSLQNPVDVDIFVSGVKWFRRWMSTPSHRTLEPVELVPGSNVTTDEEIRAALRSSVFGSFAHPAGTTAMGPRDHGGVVDAQLRVHGLRGLRVVDASVIPLIPACHLQATVLAIAEKAADLIKGV
jgi:choline dehydrogenase-like flavoprotein